MRGRIVAIAAVLGLAFAGISAAVPAQADANWDFLNSWLTAPGSDMKAYEGPISIQSSPTDSTITVNGDKTVIFGFTASVTSQFADATFTIAPGASLTIDAPNGVTFAAANTNVVFAGSGTVTIGGQNGIATVTSASTVFGTSGDSTILSGSSLALSGGAALASGSVNVTNGGTISGATIPTSATLTNSSTGTIAATNALTNSGTITNSGDIEVGTAGSGILTNNGTILPQSGSTLNAQVTVHNYVIGFTTTGSEAAIAPRTVYAATFDDAQQTIPWPTDTTLPFEAWDISGTNLTGTTALSGVAASGARTNASEVHGSFTTDSPVVGETLGFGGTVQQYIFTFSADGSTVQTGHFESYTPQTADVGKDLSLSVDVTMLAGYSPTTITYTKDFGTVTGTFVVTPPTITGLAAVGSTLVADASASFSPTASITYQWLYNNGVTTTVIGTGATYIPTDADLGHVIAMQATGTLANYTTAVTVLTAGPIAAAPIVTLGSTDPTAGDTIDISASGLAGNTDYTVELHSTPVVLAVLHSSPFGMISGRLTIPANTAGGTHAIVILGPGGLPVSSTAITVTSVGLASTGGVFAWTAIVEGGGTLVLGLILLVLGYRRRLARTRATAR